MAPARTAARVRPGAVARTAARRAAAVLAAVFLGLALCALPAAARDLAPAERAAVATRVEAFDAALRANDFRAITTFIPPDVFATIAAANRIEVDKLLDVVVQQMAVVMKDVTIEKFEIDVAGAEQRQLPDGTPYLLMPTITVVRMSPDTRIESENQTLALAQGDVWYFVRLDDPEQVNVLRRAFPAFANETLPLGASRQLP